jgi:hypothetical protein
MFFEFHTALLKRTYVNLTDWAAALVSGQELTSTSTGKVCAGGDATLIARGVDRDRGASAGERRDVRAGARAVGEEQASFAPAHHVAIHESEPQDRLVETAITELFFGGDLAGRVI